MISPSINELDVVVLEHGLPAYGLAAGDVGTVVHVHEGGAAFEVEFVTGRGETVAVLTLASDEVRRMEGQEILHARTLAA